MRSSHWLSWIVSVALAMVSLFAQAADASNAPQNSIETLLISKAGGNTILKIGMRNSLPAQPSSFSITNPARLVFDFPDTANSLGFSSKSINEGGLRSLNVVQAGDRSRLILNLDKSARFESRLEEKFLLITLVDEQAQAGSGAVGSQHFSAGTTQSSVGIRDIQFRRSKDGAGVVVIEMTSSDGGIDLQQKGGSLFASFKKTRLPDNLRRQMDVVDFATPVVSVKTRSIGDDVSMEIIPKGLWEHIAFQSDNQFIIEVKPIKEDGGKIFQGTRSGFQGEAISLNFQNIPVRELLHVFADITNFNIVVSDSVSGNVSLRLNDIPWDQALDIVLEQRNLAMRKNGNVMWIAPRDELAAKDKLQAEARDAALIAEVPRMEVFQLNYQKAEDFGAMLSASKASGASGGSGGFLSSLGSVSVDKRTNQIFIHDVPTKLALVRDLLVKVDRPARQVLIEARIVEASDRFTKNLGVRLGIVDRVGYRTGASSGNPRVMLGGSTQITGFQTGQQATTPNYISTGTDDTFSVDMPASNIDTRQVGQFSLTLFNSSLTQFLNLELSALEVDGKGKIISSPRIVTADQVEALIEQGTEVPFLTASASGATTVGYKKAVLALKVKPQITPEGKVIMAIEVSKDSPNPQYSTTYGIALDTKHIKTDVLVENGGTVVIGGIYTQEERDTNTRIPLLGDLPYVGFMFRNRERQNLNSELLVFITPKIIPDVNLN
ncbi:MAG: type IV pilus secretin PilQ [Rhodocyclaceae bacterium]|nr:type IV pilus secretin PilQ [Rhodocyclaceae bacterium]MDZ4215846.1 type IV pilus secretin PilQ [Rhodocyclaceae bacterium]